MIGGATGEPGEVLMNPTLPGSSTGLEGRFGKKKFTPLGEIETVTTYWRPATDGGVKVWLPCTTPRGGVDLEQEPVRFLKCPQVHQGAAMFNWAIKNLHLEAPGLDTLKTTGYALSKEEVEWVGSAMVRYHAQCRARYEPVVEVPAAETSAAAEVGVASSGATDSAGAEGSKGKRSNFNLDPVRDAVKASLAEDMAQEAARLVVAERGETVAAAAAAPPPPPPPPSRSFIDDSVFNKTLRVVFGMIDTHNTNSLNRRELLTGVMHNTDVTNVVRAHLALLELLRPSTVKLAFEDMDTDVDGHVSFDEFVSFATRDMDNRRVVEKDELVRSMLRRVFDLIDINGSDSVERSEIIKVMKTSSTAKDILKAFQTLSSMMHPGRCADAFKALDPERDGNITFEHFAHFCGHDAPRYMQELNAETGQEEKGGEVIVAKKTTEQTKEDDGNATAAAVGFLRIVYCSKLVVPDGNFGLEMISAISKSARAFNQTVGITGGLYYNSDTDMVVQVLEGPHCDVDLLLEKVRADTRHVNFRVLERSTQSERREFEGWAMKECTSEEWQHRYSYSKLTAAEATAAADAKEHVDATTAARDDLEKKNAAAAAATAAANAMAQKEIAEKESVAAAAAATAAAQKQVAEQAEALKNAAEQEPPVKVVAQNEEAGKEEAGVYAKAEAEAEAAALEAAAKAAAEYHQREKEENAQRQTAHEDAIAAAATAAEAMADAEIEARAKAKVDAAEAHFAAQDAEKKAKLAVIAQRRLAEEAAAAAEATKRDEEERARKQAEADVWAAEVAEREAARVREQAEADAAAAEAARKEEEERARKQAEVAAAAARAAAEVAAAAAAEVRRVAEEKRVRKEVEAAEAAMVAVEMKKLKDKARARAQKHAAEVGAKAVNSGDVDFVVTIHRAEGLAKADTFGKSDPFCEVYWSRKAGREEGGADEGEEGGEEKGQANGRPQAEGKGADADSDAAAEHVGTTAVVKKTLDPVWENERFRLSARGDSATTMTIKLFDWDRVGANTPLGWVQVDSASLLTLSETHEPQSYAVVAPPGEKKKQLTAKGELFLSCERCADTSSVGILAILFADMAGGDDVVAISHLADMFRAVAGSPNDASEALRIAAALPGYHMLLRPRAWLKALADCTTTYTPCFMDESEFVGFFRSPDDAFQAATIAELPAAFMVTVECATDLAKADTFGKSDPFVELTWSGDTVGKTAVAKGTLNPTWEGETFTLPVEQLVTDARTELGYLDQQIFLDARVYDWDRVGASTLLGSTTVPFCAAIGHSDSQASIECVLGEVKGKNAGKSKLVLRFSRKERVTARAVSRRVFDLLDATEAGVLPAEDIVDQLDSDSRRRTNRKYGEAIRSCWLLHVLQQPR